VGSHHLFRSGSGDFLPVESLYLIDQIPNHVQYADATTARDLVQMLMNYQNRQYK